MSTAEDRRDLLRACWALACFVMRWVVLFA
jgi:hypothetical protein